MPKRPIYVELQGPNGQRFSGYATQDILDSTPVHCVLSDPAWEPNGSEVTFHDGSVWQPEKGTRTVVTQPANGGDPCGPLVEYRLRRVSAATSSPNPLIATAVNLRTGIAYGGIQTGARRNIKTLTKGENGEAAHGDEIWISPGHIFTPGVSGEGDSYLEGNCLPIAWSLTIRRIPGEAHWTLAPADTNYLDGRSGILIWNPKNCRDVPNGTLGYRLKVVIEGFDFWNWGRNADDVGIKIRVGDVDGRQDNWNAHNESVTIRDFKMGKLPNYESGSGILGAAETLIVEDGHLYNIGGGLNGVAGNDHNAYISGRNVYFRRMLSERTRKNGANAMDGHILKIRGVNVYVEDCNFVAGPDADNSAVIQFYGGGNMYVRRCKLEQTDQPSNGSGMIWYDNEVAQQAFFYGEAGHSLTIENNEFLSHHSQPPVFVRQSPVEKVVPVACSDINVTGNSAEIIGPLASSGFISSACSLDWVTEGNTVIAYGDTGTTLPPPSDLPPVSSMPLWRQNMTNTHMVYEVGEAPTNATIAEHGVWPGGVIPNTFYGGWSGGTATTWQTHFGYGGSVYMPDVGGWGTMVFGGTGEGQLQSQLTKFNLSDDAPTWDVLQQPRFYLNSSDAALHNAGIYYNPTEAATFPAPRDSLIESLEWDAAWDGTFPIAVKGWVIPQKIQSILEQGDRVPHAFRYNMPAYLPASITGSTAGHIVVNTRAFYGPWNSGNRPRYIDDARLYDNEAWFIYVMNVATKEWVRVTQTIPIASSVWQLTEPWAFTDWAASRIYYTYNNNGNNSYYYVDFTTGIETATISSPINFETMNYLGINGSIGNVVFCNNNPTGRKIGFGQNQSDRSSSFVLFDFDNNRLWAITDPPGLTLGELHYGFGYDARLHRLIITAKNANGVWSAWAQIPTDPTLASNWSFTTTQLALNSGLTIENSGGAWQYGQRNEFIPSLQVIFMTQKNNKMLAYRPYAD